ncbi:ryanodine receptor 1-like [Pseudonaja textilis]|uniref:ryanodine receptor 1-like n=1 Tax=Pseudonaja textilis TaxID=8673 RepID=UPI000EAA3AF6|nr:ryanodine receptor 1-like [Pseudonaja textilis]
MRILVLRRLHQQGEEAPVSWGEDADVLIPESPSPSWLCSKDDEVVLQCSTVVFNEQLKLCLATEGFGNRLCFLEPTSNAQKVPPDLAICCFSLEQSLSVRALQEMLANTVEAGVESSQGGGHRTLLYGHAILLRHSHSGMYLSCLTTSRSLTDKLAFDVGLQEDASDSNPGEACWWTIHPASKQRSEGEKVRVGDDLILVSVSSERYLVRVPKCL